MEIPYSQLGDAIKKSYADFDKRFRLAQYKTLGELAKQSRLEVIKIYPSKFPDEDGVRKNKGVPKQVVYDNKVNKSIPGNPSIRIYASDKIQFMEKQEFGGNITGGKSGRQAAVPFKDSLKTMRSGTKGMKEKYTISNVMASVKAAMSSSIKSKDGGKPPKPFFMQTESGHTMVAIRKGKKRLPIIPLYHFDRKRTFRKRWDFFETVEGIVVSMTDKVWSEQLKKALDKK